MGDLVAFPKLRSDLVDPATGFYSPSQVAKYAMVPLSTLLRWQNDHLIEPTLELVEDDTVIGYGYSYADLTIIRMLRSLREGRLDLDSAGTALAHLYQRLGPPSAGWAAAHIYIVGNRIFAEQPDDWGITLASQYGQTVEPRLFGSLFEDLRRLEPDQSFVVPSEFWGYVNINPEIMGGLPTLKGTRVPTETVARLFTQGTSITALVRMYSRLLRDMKRLKVFITKAVEYEQLISREPTTTTT